MIFSHGRAYFSSFALVTGAFVLLSVTGPAETAGSYGQEAEVIAAQAFRAQAADDSGALPLATAEGILMASDTARSSARHGSQQRNGDAAWEQLMSREYDFSVDYPPGFVVRPQDISRLGHFSTGLVASFYFMNPTMASGDLAGIEPPDLEVRVYRSGMRESLEDWLVSVEFASVQNGTVGEPYRSRDVDGLKVCPSTMIAPGCSIFVLRNGLVYQMTAASLVGEGMLETFTFLSP